MKRVLLLLPVLVVVGACGHEVATQDAAVAQTTTTSTSTTTTTTTPETTTATTTTKKSKKTTDREESPSSSRSSSKTTKTTSRSSSRSTPSWDGVLPGLWRAPQPGGGEELWNFNGDTHGVTWNFWPQGIGVRNPLNNGVPAPVNIGYRYKVKGDTLTVSRLASSTDRVYEDLRPVGSDCFSANFRGDRIKFCRYTG